MTEEIMEQVKPSKKEQILLLNQKIEALSKELEGSKNQEKWSRERASEAEKQIEEMQCLLDTLPGVVGRKTSDDYYAKAFSLSARFCSWLATRIS